RACWRAGDAPRGGRRPGAGAERACWGGSRLVGSAGDPPGAPMSFAASREVAAIRARLDHPVIDADGHLIEYAPLVRDFVAEEAGEAVAKRFDALVHGSQLVRQVPLAKRRELGMTRMPWWGLPTRNTLDRATAMLPALMHRRLDELGIDFALPYPTYRLVVPALARP